MKTRQIQFLIFFLFCGGAWLFLSPAGSSAEENREISISPSIIDERAEARDILEYAVKLKNNSQQKIELYPFVNDLTKNEGEQPFINPADLDKTVSLARWIEISRAVIELMPGEEKAVPVKININAAARPGKYFAAISFGRGSNRNLAAINKRELNQPEVLLNMEVKEHVIEKVENSIFEAEREVNFKSPVRFFLEVKNIGNKDILPKGSLLIYDRQGHELETLAINSEQNLIRPQETKQFRITWPSGRNMGRFKARLELEYGDSRKDINDVIFFWILPWQLLVIFLALFLAAIFSLWLLLARVIRHNRELARQALEQVSGRQRLKVTNLKDKQET